VRVEGRGSRVEGREPERGLWEIAWLIFVNRIAEVLEQESTERTERLVLCWLCFLLFKIRC